MKKSKDNQYYEGIGRRKQAVARVRLYVVGADKTASVNGVKIKKGEIYLNKKPIESKFAGPTAKAKYLAPLLLTGCDDRFAVSIITRGGGDTGQLDAISHGLARAIEKVDREEYRPALKKALLLRRDPRVKERRKVGTGGKARRKKQSPKR